MSCGRSLGARNFRLLHGDAPCVSGSRQPDAHGAGVAIGPCVVGDGNELSGLLGGCEGVEGCIECCLPWSARANEGGCVKGGDASQELRLGVGRDRDIVGENTIPRVDIRVVGGFEAVDEWSAGECYLTDIGDDMRVADHAFYRHREVQLYEVPSAPAAVNVGVGTR